MWRFLWKDRKFSYLTIKNSTILLLEFSIRTMNKESNKNKRKSSRMFNLGFGKPMIMTPFMESSMILKKKKNSKNKGKNWRNNMERISQKNFLPLITFLNNCRLMMRKDWTKRSDTNWNTLLKMNIIKGICSSKLNKKK